MSNTECLRGGLLHDSKFGVRYSIFKGPSAGFTLLELMISISILGIMILILMGVLRLGFRSVEAGGKKIDSLERVRASLTVIESQIQSVIPMIQEVNGETKLNFTGDRTSLEVTTNYSIWEGEIGYSVVSYRVSEGDKGKWSLMASESRIGQEIKREIRLLDQLDDFYFEYYYKDPTEEKGQWVDQWPGGNTLPEKIRLHWTTQGKVLSLIIPMKSGWSLTAPGVTKKS
ncbi:MAG: type II secretion system protein GspJ [Thermodesulfobacteriota bacterium]